MAASTTEMADRPGSPPWGSPYSWTWNVAINNQSDPEDAWVPFFDGTWTITGDLSAAQPFVEIMNWGVPQTNLHSFSWECLQISGVPASVDRTWVDYTWAGLGNGTKVGDHYIGYDAYSKIQDGIDRVNPSGYVIIQGNDYFNYMAGSGEYVEQVVIDKPVALEGVNYPAINPASGAAITLRSPGSIPVVGVTIVGIDTFSGSYGILIDEAMWAHFGEQLVVQDLRYTGSSWNAHHALEGVAILRGAEVVGFAIDGASLWDNLNGIGISGPGTIVTDLSIEDSILHDNRSHGFHVLAGAEVSDLSVEDTMFYGNRWQGIFLENSTAANWHIADSEFISNDMGIAISGSDLEGLILLGSTIEGNSSCGLGVIGDWGGTPAAHAVEDVSIIGNQFENNGWEHIYLAMWGSNVALSDILIGGNAFAPGSTALAVGSGAEFGDGDVVAVLNTFETGGTGVWNGSATAVDATLNWWGDADGPGNLGTIGDRATGNVVFSPWLGVDPDTIGAPGVQLGSPLLFVVAPVGPEPQMTDVEVPVEAGLPIAGTVVLPGGYLNRAIGAANLLPGVDTIEVRHGTYDASEPITEAVTLMSEAGSAAHTHLLGDLSLGASNILLGGFRNGFTVHGDVTVLPGYDASTIHINWNDLLGLVTNNGLNILDATFNWWGGKHPATRTIGFVDYWPWLALPSDTIIGFVDLYDLDIPDAMVLGELVAAGLSEAEALVALEVMNTCGYTMEEAITLVEEVGWIRVASALRRAMGDCEQFAIQLAGYGFVGGGGGLFAAGAGGATGQLTYEVGESILVYFVLTHPFTGEVIPDAVVSAAISRPVEDEYTEILFFDVAPFNEEAGEYQVEVDTTGWAPGVYDVWVGTGALDQFEHTQVTLAAPEE